MKKFALCALSLGLATVATAAPLWDEINATGGPYVGARGLF